MKNFLFLSLLLCLNSSKHALAKRATVDTSRTIAQPVKARKIDRTPRFLKRMTYINEKGFSLACHVCLHYAEHFVTLLQANEVHDKTKTVSGWRMDERKVVGYRGQDSNMMDMMDTLCRQFKAHDGYSECRGKVCEQVPTDKKLKSQIKRGCVEFKEDYEDNLVRASRKLGDDGKIAGRVCKEIYACTGKEKIKYMYADTLKEQTPEL
jgi:hypothetical protein